MTKKLKLQKASPTILTCIGAFGVIATSVMTAKATLKAVQLLQKTADEKEEKLTKLEMIRTAGPVYIPAVLLGASTISCIFGANILNKHQQAALTSAYALLNQSYKDYKKKVKELCGEETHNTIVESIAKEKCSDMHIVAPNAVSNSTLDFNEEQEPEIIRTFYDSFGERYFESTISRVIQAEYHLNRNFLLSGVVSLNDFYELLGLDKTELGENVGWSSVDGDIYWIDFDHHKTALNDGMEVLVIDMVFNPTIEWLNDI